MIEEIGTAKLSRLLGISDRHVRLLAEQGTIPKRGRGKYDLVEAVATYCEHLREIAAGRGGGEGILNLTEERALLAQEQRIGQEIKNAAARGELVERADVLSGWSDVLRRVRSRLLAVPSRVRTRRSRLLADDIDAVDSEIREALEELADGQT